MVTRVTAPETRRLRRYVLTTQASGRELRGTAWPHELAGTLATVVRDTQGTITHFVSSMGTTGTIMGVSKFLKEKNPAIQIIGVQPAGEENIPGIRRWPKEYLPKIFDGRRVDRNIDITPAEAEAMTRRLAAEEGIFAGISSGGAIHAALRLSAEVEKATIVTIICDRGDRYLSTKVFPA